MNGKKEINQSQKLFTNTEMSRTSTMANTPIGLLEAKFGKDFILRKVTKSTVIGSGSFG